MGHESASAETFPFGPWLSEAVICEKVIEEKDGVISLIRIVDRIVVNTSADGEVHAKPIPLALVIGFKGGSARGRHTLAVQPENPSGLRGATITVGILFEGEDRGQRIVLKLEFEPDTEGLHWFDVKLDEKLVTRMPLRVMYQPVRLG